MELVIKIPEKVYKSIINGKNCISYQEYVEEAIKNGVPLSKGHGKLKDVDRLKTHFVGTEQGTDLEVYLESTIIDAPTIIEAADNAESDK